MYWRIFIFILSTSISDEARESIKEDPQSAWQFIMARRTRSILLPSLPAEWNKCVSQGRLYWKITRHQFVLLRYITFKKRIPRIKKTLKADLCDISRSYKLCISQFWVHDAGIESINCSVPYVLQIDFCIRGISHDFIRLSFCEQLFPFPVQTVQYILFKNCKRLYSINTQKCDAEHDWALSSIAIAKVGDIYFLQ